MVSDTVRCIAISLIASVIMSQYAEAQFLRRIIGEHEFCQNKLSHCLHERPAVSQRNCEHRVRDKYGCAFHGSHSHEHMEHGHGHHDGHQKHNKKHGESHHSHRK